jgi:hypothetical protein
VILEEDGHATRIDALPEARVVAAAEDQQRAAGPGENLAGDGLDLHRLEQNVVKTRRPESELEGEARAVVRGSIRRRRRGLTIVRRRGGRCGRRR